MRKYFVTMNKLDREYKEMTLLFLIASAFFIGVFVVVVFYLASCLGLGVCK